VLSDGHQSLITDSPVVVVPFTSTHRLSSPFSQSRSYEHLEETSSTLGHASWKCHRGSSIAQFDSPSFSTRQAESLTLAGLGSPSPACSLSLLNWCGPPTPNPGGQRSHKSERIGTERAAQALSPGEARCRGGEEPCPRRDNRPGDRSPWPMVPD